MLQHVSTGHLEKRIRMLTAYSGRLSYRTEAARPDWQTYPNGWHLIDVGGINPQLEMPPYNGVLGFEAAEGNYGNNRLGIIAVHVIRISVPLWFPVLIFGIAPAYWLTHRRQYPGGHCQECGYDLRASPDQCPECGAIPESRDPSSER